MEARLVSAVQNAARGLYGKRADSVLTKGNEEFENDYGGRFRRRAVRRHRPKAIRAKGCLLRGSVGAKVI